MKNGRKKLIGRQRLIQILNCNGICQHQLGVSFFNNQQITKTILGPLTQMIDYMEKQLLNTKIRLNNKNNIIYIRASQKFQKLLLSQIYHKISIMSYNKKRKQKIIHY